MNRLADKGLLILLCILCILSGQITIGIITGLLAAVSVSSLCEYFNNDILDWICAVYIILCIFNHSLFAFMPLIVYDCFGSRRIIVKFCWLLPVLTGVMNEPVEAFFACLLLSVLALWLSRYHIQYADVRDKYMALQDDAKEYSMSLERKNRELMEKQDYEVRLATLSERNRIAREIHDNVGHLLTRAILQVGALQVINRENKETVGQLSSLKDTLSDAMDNIRSSVHDLHDESIDLRVSICSLINEFTFCPVRLDFDADNPSKEIKYCFIAIVKEALSNITKHSNADHVHISLLEHPAFYQLIIEDNGTVKGKGISEGIGLQNMKDRTEALRGTFRADDSRGFKIFISIPKEKTERNET